MSVIEKGTRALVKGSEVRSKDRQGSRWKGPGKEAHASDKMYYRACRETGTSTLRDAAWLAWREMRESMLYHLTLAAGMLAAGTFMVFFFLVALDRPLSREPSGGLLPSDVTAAWHSIISDWFFLVALLFLTAIWSSRRLRMGQKSVGRLVFLRSLPISIRHLVLSQAMRMGVSLALSAPLLFVPAYLFVGSLREELSPVQYLWFAALWIAYSVIIGGVISCLELGASVKFFDWFFFYATWATLLVAILVNVAFGTTLIEVVIGLVQRYGPLPPAIALLVGFVGLFSVWRLVTAGRLKKRDLEF